MSPNGPRPGPTEQVASTVIARVVECGLLLVVCVAVFWVGLGAHGYIQTEPLRALVAVEMLDVPALSMPTVHHRPYTNKPPLYAWTTAALARGVGWFNEGVARVPSAAAGTLLILLLYGVAESLIGRGAGIPAACLALVNPSILDYSTRAELDMGFTLLTSVSLLLAYGALRSAGWLRSAAWMACYLVATLAAMWKAPHVLFFLWATLWGYGWMCRRWSWLRHPAQVIGLGLCLLVLASWAGALAAFAGPSAVARIAVIELIARLVPRSLMDVLSILYSIPMIVIIALPASLFLLAGMRRGVFYEQSDPAPERSPAGFLRLASVRFRRWWAAVSTDPFLAFLMAWLFANLVWCVIVPAKAPRYWLPLFPPILLLAAAVLRRAWLGAVSPAGRRNVGDAWLGIYVVIGGVGVAALLFAAARPFLGIEEHVGGLGPVWVWLVMGSGWLIAAVIGARRNQRGTMSRCLGLLVVIVAAKPVLAGVWWPARVASDSFRHVASEIGQAVPDDATVYLIRRSSLPEIDIYCHRHLEWYESTEPLERLIDTTGGFFLLSQERFAEMLDRHDPPYEVLLDFERHGEKMLLVRTFPADAVDLKQAGRGPAEPE